MKFRSVRIASLVACLTMLLALGVTAARAQQADDDTAPEMRSKPPILQVAGTWSGTANVDDGGSGTCNGCPMSLDLTQKEKKIGGTFDITTADENPTGTLKGTIKANDLLLKLHANMGSKQNCTATLTATVSTGADGDTMSGSWTVSAKKNCKGTGTFSLTRQ